MEKVELLQLAYIKLAKVAEIPDGRRGTTSGT
jgi:hypothetical protein